jgi:hypothetical protein
MQTDLLARADRLGPAVSGHHFAVHVRTITGLPPALLNAISGRKGTLRWSACPAVRVWPLPQERQNGSGALKISPYCVSARRSVSSPHGRDPPTDTLRRIKRFCADESLAEVAELRFVYKVRGKSVTIRRAVPSSTSMQLACFVPPELVVLPPPTIDGYSALSARISPGYAQLR